MFRRPGVSFLSHLSRGLFVLLGRLGQLDHRDAERGGDPLHRCPGWVRQPALDDTERRGRDAGVVCDRFLRQALVQVLTLHPTQLRLSELVLEIVAGTPDFAQKDAIERAVRDLVAAGLLFRNGELVLPTRAALRFDEIFGEGM